MVFWKALGYMAVVCMRTSAAQGAGLCGCRPVRGPEDSAQEQAWAAKAGSCSWHLPKSFGC